MWSICASGSSGNRSRLSTTHQMGTVFDRASGMPFNVSIGTYSRYRMHRLLTYSCLYVSSPRLCTCSPLARSSTCKQRYCTPMVSTNNFQYLGIQPPKAKRPLPIVSIGGFKIRTLAFALWRYIPAPTSLVRNQWQIILLGSLAHKF